MAVIELTADTELSQPIRLGSRDILRGNGYRLKPAANYEGIACDIYNANYAKVENVHFHGFHRAISISGKSNFTHVENVFIVDCITGITSHSAWDSHFQNVQILRAEVCVILTGSVERPSNPHTFYNLQCESFKTSAVVVEKTHNVEFHGGKFHGKITEPPRSNTFQCLSKNWPTMSFYGGKFFFNPNNHFDSQPKPKVTILNPKIDSVEDMGNVRMIDYVINERG